MSKEIKTEIRINASPAKIWAILIDFKNYPNWNPFIKSISGEAKKGAKIKTRIQPPGASAMVFTPTILSCESNKELKWLGHLLFKGLFDGEHHFELIDNGDGSTTFRQNETFRGLLIGIFNPAKAKQGFEAMNLELKKLAEMPS